MRNRAHQSTRLDRRRAFEAIFNAFKWLADNKSHDHKVEWLDDYPLLATGSPRDAFLNFQFLCHPSKEADERSVTIGPFAYARLARSTGLFERLVDKGRFVAFTYLDTPFHSQDLRREILLRQQAAIRDLFKKNHDSEDLLVVRSDTLQSNGKNSIKESITNLIAAKFLMSNGYMVLEDVGSGPDLIAFKTNLLEELRARGFIGRGASVSQLATIRTFGKATDIYREDCPNEEIIAVESESINPQSGIKQLKGEFSSQGYLYMGFFDRRVLATPFFYRPLKGLDVLTYDANGIQYRACGNVHAASNFWKSKKEWFVKQLYSSIREVLLLNLTFEEIKSMISSKPLTMYEVFQGIPNLETIRILDKIESIL